jgi:GNAT superfamily N-acetyltransferase
MIRPAEERDAAQLAELMTQLGYPTSTKEMAERMRHISRDQNFKTFLSVEGGEVRGMIGLCVSPSYEHNTRNGRIIALTVHERCRRLGIGRELVGFAEDFFTREGVGRVAVTSHSRRKDAHKFYESLGYTLTGLRFIKDLDVAGTSD